MNDKRLRLYKLSLMIGLSFSIGGSLHASIVRISDENHYNNQVTNAKKQVLVQFSAEWCSVCNGIQKSLEEIASEPEFNGVTFVQVDVDKCDGISKRNGIVGVPTFVYLENGSKKVEEIGVQNMPTFKTHLRDNLRKTFQVAANNDVVPQPDDKMDKGTMQETAKVVPVQVPAEQKTNVVMSILNPIKDFIMLIISKIQQFFSTILEAIKGFFS